MLNSCCIVDPQSCLMALLAVSIALEYMQRANRYIPEAIAALYSISDYLYVQRILVVMTVQVGWTDQSFAFVYQYHVLFVFGLFFLDDHCEWITDSTLSVHNEKIAPFIQSKVFFSFSESSIVAILLLDEFSLSFHRIS